MEHRLRNNGEAMRNKVRSTERPSEHSERLERLVSHYSDTFEPTLPLFQHFGEQ